MADPPSKDVKVLGGSKCSAGVLDIRHPLQCVMISDDLSRSKHIGTIFDKTCQIAAWVFSVFDQHDRRKYFSPF